MTPASPPDVRQGSALPVNLLFNSGLCPRFGLRPLNFLGQRPDRGHSPNL